MKTLRTLFAIAVGVGSAASAMGQASPTVNLEALTTVRRDVRRALREIQAAMPIYEGHRATAISSAHEAEALLNTVIVANTPPAEPKPATAEAHPVVAPHPVAPAKSKEESKKAEPAKAAVATKPAEQPKTAEELKADQQKHIAESQARFRKGLEHLQQAIKDLKAAESSLPADQAAKVAKLLQTAQDESTKSIAVHEKEG